MGGGGCWCKVHDIVRSGAFFVGHHLPKRLRFLVRCLEAVVALTRTNTQPPHSLLYRTHRRSTQYQKCQPFLSTCFRSWQDNLALTTDRVLTYRTGRVGVCLIAAMIYISLVSVDLFVPDWSDEHKAEADANLAKDIYYNDDDEVCFVALATCAKPEGLLHAQQCRKSFGEVSVRYTQSSTCQCRINIDSLAFPPAPPVENQLTPSPAFHVTFSMQPLQRQGGN